MRISDENTNYGGVGALLAVVGFFILIVGAIGLIGVGCGTRKVGRFMLLVVSQFLICIIELRKDVQRFCITKCDTVW